MLQSTAVVRVSEGNRLILESKLLSPVGLPSSVLPALHLLCTHLAGLGPPLARVSPWALSNSPPYLAQSGFSPTSPIVTPVNTPAGINSVMCPCCPTSDCWAHTIVVGGDSSGVLSSFVIDTLPLGNQSYPRVAHYPQYHSSPFPLSSSPCLIKLP